MADETFDKIEAALNELGKRLSALRKEGADMTYADLTSQRIPYKIKYAKVSREAKDLDVVNKLLDELRAEIDEGEKAHKERAKTVEELAIDAYDSARRKDNQ